MNEIIQRVLQLAGLISLTVLVVIRDSEIPYKTLIQSVLFAFFVITVIIELIDIFKGGRNG